MPEPIVSILIPTYNRSAYLLEALASAYVAQDYSFEILISDNASSDDTVMAFQNFMKQPQPKGLLRIELITQLQNLGMVGNWNALLALARGKYIKLLCDDDALRSGALQREVSALEQDPSTSLCASARFEIEDKFFSLPEEVRLEFADLKQFRPQKIKLNQAQCLGEMVHAENIFGSPSTVLFRRDLLAQFPTEFRYAADWAGWLELCEKGDAIFLPDAGCLFRLHGASLTSRFVAEGIDLEEVFRLRWRALKKLEKIQGRVLTKERSQLAFALWVRLTRRWLKLILGRRFKSLMPITQRVMQTIRAEQAD